VLKKNKLLQGLMRQALSSAVTGLTKGSIISGKEKKERKKKILAHSETVRNEDASS